MLSGWKQLSQTSNEALILQKYADNQHLNFDQNLQPAG